jgi:hypothetical protein
MLDRNSIFDIKYYFEYVLGLLRYSNNVEVCEGIYTDYLLLVHVGIRM